MSNVFSFFKQFIISIVFQLKPGKNLLIAFVLLSLLGIPASIWSAWQTVWQASMALMIMISIWDLFRLYSIQSLQIERDAPGKMSVGLWHDIKLTLRYQAPGIAPDRIRLKVFDHYPVDCDMRHMPRDIILRNRQWVSLDYQIKPLKRGNESFQSTQCLIESPWKLWQRNRHLGQAFTAMVYPNFAAITQYAILATENRLSQLGIRKIRRRGEGMDFNQLREYREGDSLRQIDWKATARLRKLISREYQDEKDQEILFLIDCGRRMLSKDEELSHFDYTLNAMLLLSYVALHQGDAVGFSTFATDIDNHIANQRWMPARKGMATIQTLLNNVYDLHASTITPDYTQAATQFLLRQKKRALVIILTNLREEDNHDLLNALKLLQRKHLVILASLREQVIDNVMHKKINDFSEALLFAATCDYQNQRKKMFENLHARGINFLDVTPNTLAIHLVNRYLDIKSSGLL